MENGKSLYYLCYTPHLSALLGRPSTFTNNFFDVHLWRNFCKKKCRTKHVKKCSQNKSEFYEKKVGSSEVSTLKTERIFIKQTKCQKSTITNNYTLYSGKSHDTILYTNWAEKGLNFIH